MFLYSTYSEKIVLCSFFCCNHDVSLNTIRLWVPQLFAIIKEYEVEYEHDATSIDANLCTMIEFKVNKTESIIMESNRENFNSTCEPVSFFHPLMLQLICTYFLKKNAYCSLNYSNCS